MLIAAVTELGGPCTTKADIKEMLSQQDSLLHKKKAIQTQLKYYKMVVKPKNVAVQTYRFSQNKKQLTCVEQHTCICIW